MFFVKQNRTICSFSLIYFRMFIMNNFKENLKVYRIKANLTQKELANKVEVLERTISYWESGKRECDLDTLIRLADFFNISIDELVR